MRGFFPKHHCIDGAGFINLYNAWRFNRYTDLARISMEYRKALAIAAYISDSFTRNPSSWRNTNCLPLVFVF